MSQKVQSDKLAMISEALGGLTPRRVRQLIDKGMPDDPAAAKAWYAKNVDATMARHVGGDSLQRLREAKAESAEIEARMNKLKIEKLNGTVVEFGRARAAFVQAIEIQRSGYRMMEALYAQAFSMTPTQRDEWHEKWNTQEKLISEKISALATSLGS